MKQVTTTAQVIPYPNDEGKEMLHISDFVIVALAMVLSGAIFSAESWGIFVALAGSFVGGVMLWRFRRQKTLGENLLQAGSAAAGGVILAWVVIEYYGIEKSAYVAGINALAALSVNTIVDAYLVVAEKQSFVVIIRNVFTGFLGSKGVPPPPEQPHKRERPTPLKSVNRKPPRE